jgi:uncharacterized protein
MRFFKFPIIKQTLIAFFGVFLSVSAGCSEEPMSQISAGPALWKVESGGNKYVGGTVYLFGTFHILPADVEWKTPVVMDALSGADFLVTEADTSDPNALAAIIQEYAINPGDKPLASYFTKKEAKEIDAVLNDLGLSIESASIYRPWFVALQASLVQMTKLGFDPAKGVEEVLRDEASASGKQFGYLESGADGILALAGHNDEIQSKMLLTTIEDLKVMDGALQAMLAAWATGDDVALDDLMNSSMASSPELIEAILFERNRKWIPKIEAMARREEHYFIAVGAAHLAGSNSVVEMLKAKGYVVTRQ